MPEPRPAMTSKPVRQPWLTTCVLLAAFQCGAEETAPAPLVPASEPATTQATSNPIDIDQLVTDALAGSAGAVMTLRTAGLGVDDTKAMAILERVRKSGASRHSAIAVCFVRHREAWVQRTAIATIARLGIDGRDTLDLLVKTVEDPSPIVAQAAATALGDLRDARTWAPLIELLTAKDSNQVRLAHESLQRQTNQTWPAEQSLWAEWLQKRKADEESQFASFQLMLSDPAVSNPVAAVDGLASLELLRDQATAILVTLADHANPVVRAHVEQHLRQWTGTLGGEALTIALDRAQTRAVAPPPLATVTSTATVTVEAQVQPTASAPGFFESTYGTVLIVTVCSAALAILLWFLRTPAGQLVQGATHRFTQRVGRSRVVVMISNGTKRIAKILPGPIKSMTKRLVSPAKILGDRLSEETKRMLKPTGKSK